MLDKNIATYRMVRDILGVVLILVAVGLVVRRYEISKIKDNAAYAIVTAAKASADSKDRGIFTTDHAAVVTSWNPWMERVTGIPQKEIVGKPFWSVLDHKETVSDRQIDTPILTALSQPDATKRTYVYDAAIVRPSPKKPLHVALLINVNKYADVRVVTVRVTTTKTILALNEESAVKKLPVFKAEAR